jgi:tetratricopeptide (TPR) repeat protein
VARATGKTRHWFDSGLRLPVLGLAAVFVAAIALPRVRSGLHIDIGALVTWTFVVQVVVIWALLWLALRILRDSGRLFVLAAVNHAGKDFDSFAAGLPAQVATDLGRLSTLYRTIDDANPPTRGGESVAGLKVKVSDRGETFANVVDAKSIVTLGPLSVPLRPLFAIFESSILRPRRLSSSLHQNGTCLTLLADIRGPDGNWRIERDLPAPASAEEMARTLSAMTEELVYRVFTATVPTGSTDWAAVKWFSEGLRAYRSTLNTDMDKEINLGEAERHFFEAFRVDKNFARCIYNLGVLYQRSGKTKKATAAFERALENNPRNVDAAYALSLIYQQAGDLDRSLMLAEQAITHDRTNWRTWNMKGFLWRRLQPDPEVKPAWRSSLEFREQAAGLAWRDFCLAAWRGPSLDAPGKASLDAPRKAIAIPFTNLAVAVAALDARDRRRSVLILRQAIRQRPQASLYFELGKILKEQNILQEQGVRSLTGALDSFQNALRLAQTSTERARNHAYIAETSALIAKSIGEIGTARHATLQAFDMALASPSITDKETRETLVRAFVELDDRNRLQVIERIGNLIDSVPGESDSQWLSRIARIVRNDPLRRSVERDLVAIAGWTQAVFDIRRGAFFVGMQTSAKRFAYAENRLRRGVQGLEHLREQERRYPEEEYLAFGHERLAEALRMQSKFVKALEFAERAVALNPFAYVAIRQLGLVHYGMANYDEAERELRRSLAIEPSDMLTLECIASIYWNRGVALTRCEDRRSEFRKVIRTYEQAVRLAEKDSDRGRLHFWLGRFHHDLMDYDESAKHYEMAKALGTYPLECCTYLGSMHIEMDSFEQAERHLRAALREVLQSRRRAGRDAHTMSLRDWCRTSREFSDGPLLPGYFLLIVYLESAGFSATF